MATLQLADEAQQRAERRDRRAERRDRQVERHDRDPEASPLSFIGDGWLNGAYWRQFFCFGFFWSSLVFFFFFFD